MYSDEDIWLTEDRLERENSDYLGPKFGSELPLELWLRVSECLRARDIAALSSTSHFLHDLSNALWKAYHKRWFGRGREHWFNWRLACERAEACRINQKCPAPTLLKKIVRNGWLLILPFCREFNHNLLNYPYIEGRICRIALEIGDMDAFEQYIGKVYEWEFLNRMGLEATASNNKKALVHIDQQLKGASLIHPYGYNSPYYIPAVRADCFVRSVFIRRDIAFVWTGCLDLLQKAYENRKQAHGLSQRVFIQTVNYHLKHSISRFNFESCLFALEKMVCSDGPHDPIAAFASVVQFTNHEHCYGSQLSMENCCEVAASTLNLPLLTYLLNERVNVTDQILSNCNQAASSALNTLDENDAKKVAFKTLLSNRDMR